MALAGPDSVLAARDFDGRGCVHFAAFNGRLETVRESRISFPLL